MQNLQMAEWCADNLRDVEGWRAYGLPMSSTSNDSAKLLDGAIRQMVSWRDCDQLGGIVKTFENLHKANQNDALVTAFLTGMEAMGTGNAVHSNEKFRKDVEHLEKLSESSSINERERKHLKAAALWARGDMTKAECMWESILDEYPNDLMAIKFAHDSYFFSGNAQGKRNSVGRVIPKWKKDEPCESYLHGMYAFGLEESGEYDKAEEQALIALNHRREDCWATHARAHVLEMQGRTKDGREFMEGTRADWEPGWMLACHNHWHTALIYIEEGDYETPLTLYDDQIGRRAIASEGMLDLVDAASMLWRLELQGVNVGDRWKSLYRLDDHLNDHVLSFNDVHFGMCTRRAGYIGQEQQLHESLKEFVNNGVPTSARKVAEEVGLLLYEGMMAFADEDYDKTVAYLMPIRDSIHRIGGSHAQNDVFTQTLIHACLNTGKPEHKDFARQVLVERGEKKSNSGIADRLRRRLEGMNHL